MNKRRGRLAGTCAWVVGLALAAVPAAFPPAYAESAIKVRLGTLIPQGTSAYKQLQAMGEKWKQAPGGGIALTIYPDGRMGDEAEMVRRMRVGQLQAGTLTGVGLSDIEPAVTGLQNMPMVFRTLDEMDAVAEKMRPMLEKRLEEKGFVVLFWGDAGWIRFFSKEQILVPDDLKHMKLFTWSGSPDQVDIMKEGGFNPVPLSATDILPSLKTGMIDATPMVPFYALASQIDGAAPHMLELNWAPLIGATVVTKKTWDTVPEGAKEAIRQAATEAGKEIKANNRRESLEAVDAMKKRGLVVHAVTPELEAKWREAVEAVYPKIRGRLVPEDIFDEVMRLLKEMRAAGGQGQK
ncbi:MAG: TRAP transporter substrate-binding protein DctP [Planctomycetes bacterium]|nr:TRAP transporter substrate-binding protein DctP [Planctomycetota bacterium]